MGPQPQMETQREPQIPGDQSQRGRPMVPRDTQRENQTQLGGSEVVLSRVLAVGQEGK